MTTTSSMSRRLARLEAAEQPPTAYFWAGPQAEAEIAALPPGTRAIVYRWADTGAGTWREPPDPVIPAVSGTPLRP